MVEIPAKHIFGLVGKRVGWVAREATCVPQSIQYNLPQAVNWYFIQPRGLSPISSCPPGLLFMIFIMMHAITFFLFYDFIETFFAPWLNYVYFTWVIRDFGTAEWFHSLLHAIEEQDTQNRIEISIYLTAKIKEDDMNNILVQDVGAERDAITSLRAPTHFGRPNWDRVFSSIGQKHPETDVGVFFCGPAVLSKTLKQMSNKYTQPKGTRRGAFSALVERKKRKRKGKRAGG
ncbi:NADPH oxidase B [Rhizoctonia solani AG-1 IA]|uniref:NADPH oxidase B n=1 Tax=Thanatephorus cucumeris (strain AG1-IA) TaxID=983506 RepID=L8WDT6_THACA|nr:NADPH oxidase B [Rhizoctonia solani AG-1 IA]